MTPDTFDALGYQENPKTRARHKSVRKKLKTHVSTGTRKRLRKEEKRLAQKLNPVDVSGLSLRDLESQARSETRSAYGPEVANIATQISGAKQKIADTPADFDRYRTHLSTVAASQAQAAAAQAQSMLDTSKTANDQTAPQQAQLETQAANNPFAAQALQASKDAAAGRQSLTANSAEAIKERGKIRSDLTNTFAANSHQAQGRQQAMDQGSLTKLRDADSRTKKEAGEYFNRSKSKTRSEAIDARLKQAATELTGAKFDWQKQYQANQLDIAEDRLDETKSHNDALEDQGQQRIDKVGADGGKSEFTNSQVRASKTKFRNARAIAKQYGVQKGKGKDMVGFLTAKKGFDDELARAAVMHATYGGVDAKTRKQIKAHYGFSLPLSATEKKKSKKKK